jgi:hypothetical protein
MPATLADSARAYSTLAGKRFYFVPGAPLARPAPPWSCPRAASLGVIPKDHSADCLKKITDRISNLRRLQQRASASTSKETEMNAPNESNVRRRAKQRGYLVCKSRQRKADTNSGDFMLLDRRNRVILGERFDATLADIDAFLAEKLTPTLNWPA